MGGAIAIAGASSAYLFAHFLVASPDTALIHPEQVKISNNHFVAPAGVIEIFAGDRFHLRPAASNETKIDIGVAQCAH